MLGSKDGPNSMENSSSHSPSASSVEVSEFVESHSAQAKRRRAGQLSMVNYKLNPHEAMTEDLNFLRDALDAHGLEYVLIRSVDEHNGAIRPTIAVNDRDRVAVIAALALECRGEPMYSKPVRASDGVNARASHKTDRRLARNANKLVSMGTLGGGPNDFAFVLHRPRISMNGTLRFGAKYGIRLEFWVYDDIEILLPSGNAVTRAKLPVAEVDRVTVERFGSLWPTLAGMWEPLADDIDFPIDIVFSWVDGTDVEWQRARAAKMQSYVVGEGDDHEARFRHINELKFALRSVHLFAPWIRNIIIVTDSPRPEWLTEHERVAVMPSAEFFADTSVLPTHNSHAVESQLHRIPTLSEHFIYSNDDMFFGREVTPQGFFTAGGISRFIQSQTRIGLGTANALRSGFENAARVNRELLLKKFGRTISRNLEHSPAPLRRSVLERLESEFPEDFARTASARFRSATDISVTNSLYHFYALMTGYAVPQDSLSVNYVDTTSREGIASLGPLLRKRDFDFFCLNDGSFPTVSAEERVEAVTRFLENYFPIPAPWEVEAQKTGSSTGG